jgi:hypothetical protein
MHAIRAFRAALCVLLLAAGWQPAMAQTTAASATVMVIPLVAATTTYSSDIFIRNPNAAPIALVFNFYEAKTSPTPGKRTCSNVSLAAFETKLVRLGTQCTLTAASHHGLLILEDAAAQKVNRFYAFARTEGFNGNGFTVEGFPIGNFSGAGVGTNGLKRQAAAPVYQTNCFVAALGEAVDYSITLTEPSASGTIGNVITGSLLPYEMVRYLDIFTAAGLPPGDVSLTRATFNNTNAGEPAFIAFCTVQESTYFGADFRIAKGDDAEDRRQKRLVCYSQSPCGTAVTGTGETAIPDAATKFIHAFYATPPDYIRCDLVSTRLADLEMRVRGPGDVFVSPLFTSGAGGTGVFDSGGSDKTTFYIFTGFRNAFSAANGNDGQTARLFIDVSFRETGTATFPIPYGITCTSGNGISIPYVRASRPDDF